MAVTPPVTPVTRIMHGLKSALRAHSSSQTSGSCTKLLCAFTVLGISLATLVIMTVTLSCRMLGHIEQHAPAVYWCAVGDQPGGGFSLTLAYSATFLVTLFLTVALVALAYFCHTMRSSSTDSRQPQLPTQVAKETGYHGDQQELLDKNEDVA